MFSQALEAFKNVRTAAPLVHNITNFVTVNDVANAILAVGGSPIMTDDAAEVPEIVSLAAAVNINIGTLNEFSIAAMRAAGARAVELHRPLNLDPVGTGASQLRTDTAVKLLQELHPTVVRGNASEIKALWAGTGQTQGVDVNAADAVSEQNLHQSADFAKAFAARHHCVVAMTGALDLVADAKRCIVIRNGRPEMSRITGTGCQLSGVMGAFLGANPDAPFDAAAAAVASMGVAGEIAWENMAPTDGNATYRNRIIDALYHLDAHTLEERARYELV